MRLLFTYLLLNFDRSFSGKSRNQLIWLTCGIALTLGILYTLALLIDVQVPYLVKEEEETNLLRYIITLFLDPGTNNKSLLNDRWFTIFISTCGVTLFTGILISVISNMLERRIERYRTGDIRYYLSRHIVIIGFDKSTCSLVTQLCNEPKYKKKFILIQSVTPTEIIRDKLYELLPAAYEKRIVIFHARRDSNEELELLNTHKASEIFIIGEDDEKEHDFINIDCLKQLTKIHCKKGAKVHPVPTMVSFNEQCTFALFQLNDISKQWRKYFKFCPINHQQEWARRILVERQYTKEDHVITYPALDQKGISFESDSQVHLVIIGMSKMGIALAIEAAHTMHFPNFCRDKNKKTKITFIDKNANSKINSFVKQHHHLFEVSSYNIRDFMHGTGENIYVAPSKLGEMDTDFIDVEFTFINGDAESREVQALICEWSADSTQIMSIFTCVGDSKANIAIGLNLPDCIYMNSIPIFIQQQASGTLLNTIRDVDSEDRWSKYAHVYPFGMHDNDYDVNHNSIYIAQCTNYIYEYYNTHSQIPTTMAANEELARLWYNKSTALQWSNYYSAQSIPPKMRAIGIQLNECQSLTLTKEQIDMIAQVEHNRWNIEKLLLGYRKPTTEETQSFDRDTLKKSFAHPDISPYHKLTEKQQDYDRAIVSGIPLIVKHSFILQQS